MKIKPIFESEFYHDGRDPELQRVIWIHKGVVLKGFEFFNPDDDYTEENIKHITLDGVQAFAMATEEVHKNILTDGNSKAAIFKLEKSDWLSQFNPAHLGNCAHYQIMFYDEIYDIVCKGIRVGDRKLK